MHTVLKVLVTLFLALMTLGMGSVGLCAVQGLTHVWGAPHYMALYGLVALVAVAGVVAAAKHVRDLWRDPDTPSDSQADGT